MILIISNDERMKFLAEYLANSFDVVNYNPENSEIDSNILHKVRYFIMPFGGVHEGNQIHEIVKNLPDECIILTPMKHDILNDVNQKVEVIFSHNEIAIYNSIPTAEGVIYHIIKNTNITIHNANILVFGAGRCGQTIAKSLKSLGAFVTISETDESSVARMYESGIATFDSEEHNLGNFDVIVNTVPSQVLTKENLIHVDKDCYIIDIATKPGGVDFEACTELGINAQLVPALPSMIAPKTAAYYLFRFVKRYVEEGENLDGWL